MPKKKPEPKQHPAPFSGSVLKAGALIISEEQYLRQSKGLPRKVRVLDPFAGIGLIHNLGSVLTYVTTVGIELEPEWADQHPLTEVGDATKLRFRKNSFDIVFTSPCLEHNERILTSDLRWVRAGSIRVGDEVMAFDEHGVGVKASGVPNRRKWRKATVVRSTPRKRKCVRVILEDGTSVITTPEHPWLAEPYAYGGRQAQWVASKDLLATAPFVLKQLEPWKERTSYDAGWLAGMYDGEGSLSLGVHGSPKLTMYQVEGPVADRAEKLMADFGYAPNRIVRKETINTPKPVANIYVTGGFPGMMQALGELRPTRLLSKWQNLDLSTRTIQPWKVRVVAVEDVGVRTIQEIETSEGTYIGEGFLMHNCYGNRFADHHNASDGSHRRSYKHYLGRMPSDNSAAIMHWGEAYREFHLRFLVEATRVLRPDGLFMLNISNHIRKHEEQRVAEWYMEMFLMLGYKIERVEAIPTPRYKFGKNSESRTPFEFILCMRKP